MKNIEPVDDVKVFACPTNTTNTNTTNTTCCRSEGVWPPNKYLHVSLPAFHKDKSLPNPIHCDECDDHYHWHYHVKLWIYACNLLCMGRRQLIRGWDRPLETLELSIPTPNLILKIMKAPSAAVLLEAKSAGSFCTGLNFPRECMVWILCGHWSLYVISDIFNCLES